MLDYRTWGETKNCKGCRYWSEMIAKSSGSTTCAMCINQKSENKGKYTLPTQKCQSWEEGSLGAVDDPCGNPYKEDM